MIEFNEQHIMGTLEELYWRDKILQKITQDQKRFPKKLRDYHVNSLLKQQANQTEVLYKKLDDQFVSDKQKIKYGVSPTEIRQLKQNVERSGLGKSPEKSLLIQSLLNWHDNKTRSKSNPSSPISPISSSTMIFPQSL